MRKLVWAINMTIDGFADHTAVVADDQLHDFYTDLLGTVDCILFGRKTYQLMESYWPYAAQDPNVTQSMIKFADTINPLAKVVFSKTLNKVTWNNTLLVKENMMEEVLKLKKQPGHNIAIGSISLASTLLKDGLIDEFWFLVQPIIAGGGKHLIEGNLPQHNLRLSDTRIFDSGVVVLHYEKETSE
jgi:dihydrofolate reductase